MQRFYQRLYRNKPKQPVYIPKIRNGVQVYDESGNEELECKDPGTPEGRFIFDTDVQIDSLFGRFSRGLDDEADKEKITEIKDIFQDARSHILGAARAAGFLTDRVPLISEVLLESEDGSSLARVFMFCSPKEGHKKDPIVEHYQSVLDKMSADDKRHLPGVVNFYRALIARLTQNGHKKFGVFSKELVLHRSLHMAQKALDKRVSFGSLVEHEDGEFKKGWTPVALWKACGLTIETFPERRVEYIGDDGSLPQEDDRKLDKSEMIWKREEDNVISLGYDEATWPRRKLVLTDEEKDVAKGLYPGARIWEVL